MAQEPWLTTHWNETTWSQRAAALEERLGPLLRGYLKRRSCHQKEPVLDFLFEYYNFRPASLLRWSPGLGVALQGEAANEFLERKFFAHTSSGDIALNPTLFPEKRKNTVRWIRDLLANTIKRPPVWGCFGLHEWAMVYKSPKPRHDQIPLRLSPDAIAEFVESRPLICTHFDAFRFFTPPAKPMNRLELTRENQQEYEQPGCLHANMDLYKWAYKLYPWIDSNLLSDAFEVAIQTRTIDMQASPYDMKDAGLEPIAIETVEGRQQYQAAQEKIMTLSAPIRHRLLQAYNRLIHSWPE